MPEREIAYNRPSKIRIGLAVIWLTVSLAIGGAIGAQPAADRVGAQAEASAVGH